MSGLGELKKIVRTNLCHEKSERISKDCQLFVFGKETVNNLLPTMSEQCLNFSKDGKGGLVTSIPDVVAVLHFGIIQT